MATRERPADRGSRIARADLARLGAEIHTARVGAGLSLREVGRRVGRSAAQMSRIERGLVPNASLVLLARFGAVVGLDVRTRAYPGPDPVRDIAQSKVFARLRQRIPAQLPMDTEVPLPIEGDQRAWDARIGALVDTEGRTCNLPVDIETRLVDGQSTIRRLQLKLRDSGASAALLVLADTRANRAAVAALAPLLADGFPVTARHALAALDQGRHPGGSAIVLL